MMGLTGMGTVLNFVNLLGTVVVHMVSQVFLGLHLMSFFLHFSTHTAAVFPSELTPSPDQLSAARHSLT
jgi:hypothetical protein